MARQVLLGERARNRRILAIVQGVIAAHDTLQFGEFRTISDTRSDLLIRAARAHSAGSAPSSVPIHCASRATRFGLVPDAAEIFLEHDAAQALAPFQQ